MKEIKSVFIPIGLVLALFLAGHLIWQASHARPVPVLKETDTVLDMTVNHAPLHHTGSDITIPEEYDKNSILTRLAQSEMIWIEHLYKGESSSMGEAELWISVLLEDEGFVNIYLGEKNLAETENALYEITDGAALLADIKEILTQSDAVLLGEGYSTYPVMLYGEDSP